MALPPNASTPPHTHAGAFVAVYVLTGSVLNKMNDNPMTVKKASDSFTRLQHADVISVIMLARLRKRACLS